MTTQLKKNNFSIDANKEMINTVNPRLTRPNIDHFIKRILVVRRKEKRGSVVSVLPTIAGLSVYRCVAAGYSQRPQRENGVTVHMSSLIPHAPSL